MWVKTVAFKQGNAQQLDLSGGSVGVIFNVESLHRYLHMELFLNEAYHNLIPGGFCMEH